MIKTSIIFHQTDQAKLEVATVHNLNAVRSVGFTDYELGSKQLSTVSSTQVKCADMI